MIFDVVSVSHQLARFIALWLRFRVFGVYSFRNAGLVFSEFNICRENWSNSVLAFHDVLKFGFYWGFARVTVHITGFFAFHIHQFGFCWDFVNFTDGKNFRNRARNHHFWKKKRIIRAIGIQRFRKYIIGVHFSAVIGKYRKDVSLHVETKKIFKVAPAICFLFACMRLQLFFFSCFASSYFLFFLFSYSLLSLTFRRLAADWGRIEIHGTRLYRKFFSQLLSFFFRSFLRFPMFPVFLRLPMHSQREPELGLSN